jgi:hypothetical protein
MRKKLIIGIVLAIVAAAAAVGAMAVSDLSGLRGEVSDIHYRLGDLENALRGSPSADTVETVRRRIDSIRDDLRLLSVRHHLAMVISKDETQAVWDRFGRVEQRASAFPPRPR